LVRNVTKQEGLIQRVTKNLFDKEAIWT